MIRLGEKQELSVLKKVEFGVYVGEETNREERVLLPRKQVPEGTEIGDKLEVFVYRDSKDRLIATTTEPKLLLHKTGVLRVAAVGKIGAFLDCVIIHRPPLRWGRLCHHPGKRVRLHSLPRRVKSPELYRCQERAARCWVQSGLVQIRAGVWWEEPNLRCLQVLSERRWAR